MTNGTYTSTKDVFTAYLEGDVAASFPKALRLCVVDLLSLNDAPKKMTPIFVVLDATKGNQINETGKRRIARFMREVERLGIALVEKRCANSVDWKSLI